MACQQDNFVHRYHDGRMSPAERGAFECHLAGCTDCATLLSDLRSLSRLLVSAPRPEISDATLAHYRKAWELSRQRDVLRISGWLTGAAAALLLASLVLWPSDRTSPSLASAPPSSWEVNAIMPPPPRHATERPDELIELAQWMADDLSENVAASGEVR